MSTLTNTTQKEWEAIVSCAMKAQNKYEDETTKEQVETVRTWANKWLKNRKKSNEGARKWNIEHPERHKASNERWYAGFKERMKNDPEFCEKQKAYRKKYYEEVLKPKRQAQKERRKNAEQ